MEKTMMSVAELSMQMGISLPKAYELVKQPGFPTIRVGTQEGPHRDEISVGRGGAATRGQGVPTRYAYRVQRATTRFLSTDFRSG